MNNSLYSSRTIVFASVVTFSLPFSSVYSATLVLETKPLFIGTGVTPNVFVMLDDSGSMDFETLIVPHWPACNYTINHHSQNKDRDDLIMAGCNAPEATDDQKGKNQTPGCLLLANVEAPICSSMQYQQAVPSLEDPSKKSTVDVNYKTTSFDDYKKDGDWIGYTQLDQSYCVFQSVESSYEKDGQGVWRKKDDGTAILASYDLVDGKTNVFEYSPQVSWSYSYTSNSNSKKKYNPVSPGRYVISSCGYGFGDFHYLSFNRDNVYQTSACTVSDANKNTVGLCPKDTQESDWRLYSSDFNVVYYNPRVRYDPWVTVVKKDTDPTRMGAASFSAAKSNPQSGSTGFSQTKNLATEYMDKLDGFTYEEWTDDRGFGAIAVPANAPTSCKDGTRPCRSWANNATDSANGSVDLWDSHKRFTVTGSSIKMQRIQYSPQQDTTDDLGMKIIEEKILTGGPHDELHGLTASEAIQNVANWYQYSRRRSFVAKGALGEVFNQSPEYRYGLSVINQSDKLFIPVPAASVTDYFPYDNTILSSLYSYKWPGSGTPLRVALGRVGDYFSHKELDKPVKTFDDPIIDVCQQNFALLMTDGYWNESDSLVNKYGDVDKDGAIKGGSTTTLADVARYYWETDLNSSLADRVPTNAFDTANWQHLVTFTVAFGLQGNLVDTDGDGWPNPVLKENGDWGNTLAAGEGPTRIDDMWHAAFNSKGAFFSSKNPEELVQGMKEALRIVEARRGSGATGTTTSPFINTEGNSRFVPYFNSGDWSGQLIARSLDGTATETATTWDTAQSGSAFDAQTYTDRKILVLDKTKVGADKGVEFLWANLSDEQKAFLKETGELDDTRAQARVDYIRGRGVKTDLTWLTDNNFRSRPTKLGDLVNSTPFFNNNVVYVGANDGMLHAFDASTGSEIFAYIPSKVFPRLKELSKPNYAHEYYVDGDPIVRKVGSQTILIGSLRGGGQGIFALDVTTPSSPKVLWEFNDDSGPDANKELGYTYTRPYIGKLKSGESVVVFGNGYNSNESKKPDGRTDSYVGSGQPALFIVNVVTGDLIQHLVLPSSETDKPNGLASPAVLLNADGSGTIRYVYAGDLQGDLWKFNLNVSPAEVSYGTDINPVPLFVAKGFDGQRQPITTTPILMYPPASGYLVLFGTGRYLELEDNSSLEQETQTLYGIWDRDPESSSKEFLAFSREHLLKQEIVYRGESGIQAVSDNDMLYHNKIDTLPNSGEDGRYLGWYLDLIYDDKNRGERQVVNSELRSGVLFVNTRIPESSSGCDAGGTGNKYRLCASSGGSGCSKPLFDNNKDNQFDEKDLIDTNGDGVGDLAVSSIPSTVGVLFSPNIFENLIKGTSYDVSQGSLGIPMNNQVRSDAESFGRQSWRQLLRP